ncbi:hypothetical protein POM88_013519 [Heracleum sosnowskyi]|uniref:SEC63 domain-containing protein n=1 Tax=Heracleum sosnowskyi TaxID=360622 RepID=A0AAD8J013_9APIA|nr:hypothetical protein POM88_013519 [Heracleum sosnowskyi]
MQLQKDVLKSRNRELVQLFDNGVGIHHAGMLRSDRGLTDKLFSEGLLKVLVCTATLAWGVNVLSHTVVIKVELPRLMRAWLFKSEDHQQYQLIKKDVLKSRNRELVQLFDNGVGIHHAGMLRSDRGLAGKLFSEGLLKVLVCTATLAWGVNLHAHTVVIKSRNRELVPLFDNGVGIHHAGMLRSDRGLTDKLFSEGLLKVLVCTATLAWGVNLLAHTVVIKGTQSYDPKAGGCRDLGMLDVMELFKGQFKCRGGIGYSDKCQGSLCLGWLYLSLAYDIGWDEVIADPSLSLKQRSLVTDAARSLDKAKMMRFDEKSGNFYCTELGPIASHFNIQYSSVETYKVLNCMILRLVGGEIWACLMSCRFLDEMKRPQFDKSGEGIIITSNDKLAYYLRLLTSQFPIESQVQGLLMVDTFSGCTPPFPLPYILVQGLLYWKAIDMVAHSSEFENIVVRDEEQNELEKLAQTSCPMEVKGGRANKHGKVSILIQLYISRGSIDSFSLISDPAYISASLGCIMRALFEICLRRGQFDMDISLDILRKLEERGADLDHLQEMQDKDIGVLIRYLVKQYLSNFPLVQLSATVSPITRIVLKVDLLITPDFAWKDRFHGSSERRWILVEDSENDHIYHSELFTLTKRMDREAEPFVHYIFPQPSTSRGSYPHTELLDLKPLPVTALRNNAYDALYSFLHFNPIQTQAFHVLYHMENNVLLGAPTGSGKTISAELLCFIYSTPGSI